MEQKEEEGNISDPKIPVPDIVIIIRSSQRRRKELQICWIIICSEQGYESHMSLVMRILYNF